MNRCLKKWSFLEWLHEGSHHFQGPNFATYHPDSLDATTESSQGFGTLSCWRKISERQPASERRSATMGTMGKPLRF